MNDDDFTLELTKLVQEASDKKIIKREPKIIKSADISRLPETKAKIAKMQKDGFTPEQIAQAMGFPQEQIAQFLDDDVEVGTPEQILQESLKTLLSLVPIADSVYRNMPTFQNSLAVTGLIDSSKSLLQELSHLQNKEETYRLILAKVVQPIIRTMISDMMTELRVVFKSIDSNPSKEHLETDLQTAAVNIGKKFDDAYRRSNESLAVALGLNPDAKARVLAGMALAEEKS